MLILIQDFVLSGSSLETEHLFGFRLSSSHPAVCVHGMLKRNDLD
jgi:hypothetical protein